MNSIPFIGLSWFHTFKMGWPQTNLSDHFSPWDDQVGLLASEAAPAIGLALRAAKTTSLDIPHPYPMATY